jgi:dCMP deaminase
VAESFLAMNSPTTPAVSSLSSTLTELPPPEQEVTFSSSKEMLDYATRNWRENFVTTDIVQKEVIEEFAIRPFFLLVNVDAPVLVRFKRARVYV